MRYLLDVARRQFFLWLVGLALLVLAGCQRAQDQPELVVVADVAPRRLELGDRFEVVGDGFPEGHPARIVFDGALHRAGEAATRHFRHSFAARSKGRNVVSFVPDSTELQKIVGTGDTAVHTTFRGSVRVAFGSQHPATGPVYGSLEDVAIDFFPWDVPARIVQKRALEAQRFKEFLGIQFVKGGYEVALVKPGSRAERAGIKGGDRLRSLDRVNLLSDADFVASGAGPSALLSLQRGRLQTPLELYVDVQGFRPIAADRLTWATLLVGFVAALWLVFCGPALRLLAFLERQLMRRYFEARMTRVSGTLRARGSLRDTLVESDLLPTSALGGALRPLRYLLFLVASAAFAAISMGQVLLSPDLDVPALFLVAGLLFVCAQAIGGGFATRGGWSLRKGVKAALVASVFQVPAALAMASVFLCDGSLSAEHVTSAQGILPWHYSMFSSPMLAVAFAGLLLSALPEANGPRGRLESGTQNGQHAPYHALLRALISHLQAAQMLIISGLCALLFLGGFSLSTPGDSPASGTLALLAGAALLQAKLLALLALVVGLRWLLSRVSARELVGYWVRWMLPLSLLSFLLCVLFQGPLAAHEVIRVTERGAPWVMMLLAVCGIGFLGLRVLRRFRGGPSKLTAYSMNPWL